MKTTLKDIAKRAGLSITTVSRALNGHDDVSSATKALVQTTAEQMGYVPNLSARRLKTQRADAIGLVLPSDDLRFSDPFFSELLSGIIDQIAQYGLELNITTPTSSENAEAVYLKYMRSRRVDGFILVRTERDDPRIPLLQTHGVPFVAFGRTATHDNFSFIDEDSAQGIQQAVTHLVQLGHTRLAYIGEPKTLFKSHQRAQGYINGLQAHHLPIDPALMFEGQFRQRSGWTGTHQLLDLAHPPTAIVTANDLLAIGAIRAIQERGLTVGREVSVTGFDDIMLAEYVTPALTTLHQPAHKIGTLLCQNLVKVINGAVSNPPQMILQPTLIVRNSTGPARFS